MSYLRRLGKYAVTAGAMTGAGRWLQQKTGKKIIDDDIPGSAQWPALPGLDDKDLSELKTAELEDRVQTSVRDEPIVEATTAEPEGEAANSEPAGAASPDNDASWVQPYESGACPLAHPVKVKLSSGIYHVESGTAYERTRADRCYVDSDAAEADGYRASKI